MRSKNCLVTGASSGIGRETSIELSHYAKHIYIVGRNVSKLEEVNDLIVSNGCECTIVPLDLCEENSIENLSREISKKNSSIDYLILCAGSISQLSPISSIDNEKFKAIIDLNYIANFRILKNFHLLLKNSKDAQLVVLSINPDYIESLYWGIYKPVMLALNELIMTYAKENKKTGIKAKILCPRGVNTPFRENIMPGENKENLVEPIMVAKKLVELLSNNETAQIFNI